MSNPTKVYWNGEVRDLEECQVHPFDHGLRYGAGAFETLLIRGGAIHLWEGHYQRLKRGIQWMGLEEGELPLWNQLKVNDYRALSAVGKELLKEMGLGEAILRYSIYPGVSADGLTDLSYPEPIEMVDLREVPETRGKVKNLVILKTAQAMDQPPFKSTPYLHALKGLREMRGQGLRDVGEGLLLTPEGFLSEAIFSNLFALMPGNRIWTPPAESRVLPGVTREWVLQESRRQGLRVQQSWEQPAFLSEALGIFLTNSGSGLTPVSKVYHPNQEILWSRDTSGNPVWRSLFVAFAESWERTLRSHRNEGG